MGLSRTQLRPVVLVAALALAIPGLPGITMADDSPPSPSEYRWNFDDSDPAGWGGYANAGDFSIGVLEGELCATFEGGDNAWDIAVQKGQLNFAEGSNYTLSFDARATQAIEVPLQAGGNWPDVFETRIQLTDDPQHFSFDFTPSFHAPEGLINFQVGGHAPPTTMCLDNIVLKENAPSPDPGEPSPSPDDNENMLINTVFSEGKEAWGAYGVDSEELTGDGLCLAVPAGAAKWAAGLTYNGIPVVAGESYRLRYTAKTTPSAGVRVLVGEAGGAYRTVVDNMVVLDETYQTHEFSFTPSLDFPADGEAPGQVAFHLGGASKPFDFCITEFSLEKGVVPEAYEPETGPSIRVNQLGYLPEGPKRATVVSDEESPLDFSVVDGDGDVVFEGKTSVFGADAMSGLHVHIADFSTLTTPGTYTAHADGEESYPFTIGADIYQQLRYDTLNYFYLARSGIDIDAAIVGEKYARKAGHLNNPEGSLNDSVNRGDYAVPCLTKEEEGDSWAYGDWTCPDGYSLDVIGGWYDAGDHGKYVVNGGIATAQLLSTYERSLRAPSAAKALGDSTLNLPERGNGVPDILDEARWQLEFMMSMQVPEGQPLAGMVHHKIHDVGWTGLPLMPIEDEQIRRLHRPSTAATLNLAASAAQGARLFADIDPDFADQLLAAARTAWTAAQATPDLFAPQEAGNNGGGPYDDDEVGDEFYWAAAELFLTTGEAAYKDFVLNSPYHTAEVFYPEGIFWGNTAGLGRLSLATVPSNLPGIDSVRQTVIDAADVFVENQKKEGFGTVYPGFEGEYDWGSNSAVANNQIILGVAYDLTGDRQYADAVIEAMDYLLGRNALNTSYLTGYGTVFSQNQHSRWFAAQLHPDLPHPPPGSLAGGPNSLRETWDPTIAGLYSKQFDCAPQACYVDHIQSWSTNEITVNWNSAMSWVASFVADQGAGAVDRDPYPEFPDTPDTNPDESTPPVDPEEPGDPVLPGDAGDSADGPPGGQSTSDTEQPGTATDDSASHLPVTGVRGTAGMTLVAAGLLLAGASLMAIRRYSRSS
ncbi:MAG: glycoside hydrolase family 9 protein [Actinomycetaceae bacterium]|nr:glycoside hydrolase family 9 protein [Actinomycetaceae bacterium]